MVVERRLAEAQAHGGRRRQHHAVGAEARARGREHRGRRGADGRHQRADLGGGHARHVTGNRQERLGAGANGLGLGGGHRRRVAAVLLLGERLGAEAAGDRRHFGFARHHPHAIEVGRRQRAQHIDQHRAGQLAPLGAVEHAHEPLLGVGDVLDGDGGHDHAARALSIRTQSTATPGVSRCFSRAPARQPCRA